MSSTKHATAAERLTTFAVGAAFIAVIGWGVTYIPIVNDYLPSLIVAPAQTIRLDVTSLDPGSNMLPEGLLKEPCNSIPFMLRPLASKPTSVRVVFTDGADVPLGEARYGCRRGQLISDKVY